jgi:hypothetical protein
MFQGHQAPHSPFSPPQSHWKANAQDGRRRRAAWLSPFRTTSQKPIIGGDT